MPPKIMETGVFGDVRTLNKGFFHVDFWYEISKRTSKCRLCNLPIPAKSRRVAYHSRHMRINLKNGRRVPANQIKYFAHYHCWTPPLEDHPCLDCGEMLPANVQVAICFWCQMGPRYRQCASCDTLVRSPDVRRFMLGDNIKVILCRGCRVRDDYTSEIKYTKIMERLERTGELF